MLATVAGIVAALAIVLLSTRALWRASDLQDRVNRGHALSSADARLSALLDAGESGEPLDTQVRQLVRDAGLGFTFLALYGADGTILATDGRFERLAIPLISQIGRQKLRAWLYRVTSEPGRLRLERRGMRLGEVEYALAPSLARDVREEAVRELRIVAWIGLLLALPTLAALALVVMRWPIRTDPRLLARTRQAIRRAERMRRSQTEDAPDEPEGVPEVAQSLRESGIDALDALGRGLIVVDRDARIRLMNRVAGEITGWSPDDARGKLVYSIFHPLDEQQAPLVTPAETCLREGREYEPTELFVRARNASVHPVEVMAALLREKAGAPPTGAVMVFHRIDERRELIEQLRRQSRLSLGVIDHLVEGVLTTDTSGVVRFANARALRMFGYGRDELDGTTVTKLMPVPFLNTPGLHLTDYIGGRHASRLPKVVGWRKDATTFPIELVVQALQVEDDEGLVVIVRDITERLRTDNLAQRLGRLLDAAAEEIYIFDAQSLYFVEVNRGARRNLGYQPTEISRLSMLGISRELEPETFLGHLARLRGGQVDHVRYRARHQRADGSEYPVEVRLSFSREEEPPIFMAIAVDITEREAHEQQLQHAALHDALTGLPNRGTLLDRLAQAAHTATATHRLLGVFSLDLDRFGAFNQAQGSEAGDAILQQVARRLERVVGPADTVARTGGDEFVLMVHGLRGADEAEDLARRIQQQFESPMPVEDADLRVDASLGYTLYPLDESDGATLLRHAEAAMHQAKQGDAGRSCAYAVEVSPEKRRRLELDRNLHAALALQQFELSVIPAFELEHPEALPAALLVDYVWMHPRQGRIAGRDVAAAANRAGLLVDIELRTLQQACALLPALDDAAPAGDAPPLPLVLNLSGGQLQDPDFSLHLFDLMDRHGVPPRRLMFALDRDGLHQARAVPPAMRRRLLDRGIRLALRGDAASVFAAIDDGVQGLSLDLVVLAPDEVSRTPQDAQATERLRLALLAAKGASLPVLAMGVSSAEARDWLSGQGCAYGAGSVFEAARPADAVAAWLQARAATPRA